MKKKKKRERVIEAKFVLTLSCCSYMLARKQTLRQFHQKLNKFNYGWPTLQMNLVFRALNQNGADRIEVVIVTASKRACPCFGHLKGKKKKKTSKKQKQMQITIIHIERETHKYVNIYREKQKERERMIKDELATVSLFPTASKKHKIYIWTILLWKSYLGERLCELMGWISIC